MKLAPWYYGTLCVLILLTNAVWTNHAGAQSSCCNDRWDPAKSERDRWGQGKMGPGHHQRMQRHWTFMHQTVPDEYRGTTNPVVATSANLEAGAKLYKDNCAQCHGPDGMGDGEVANTLNPSPALIAYLVQRPMAVDGYLLWSIAEGGAQFGTKMPAFKSSLKREDMWKVILYLRSGLPQLGE